MDLKISNNLFLGLQELNHLKNSLREQGYEKIFKQMISSYGIVSPYNSLQFTNLQVVDSALGQLTIKPGIAIDNDLNIIDVKSDLVDVITVPNDGVQRFVVISYIPTVIEQGTVNIQADGSIVGVGTSFVSRMRGLPNFPAKIVFPQSTLNTEEYIVQAVQSDTLASLNVAGSQIIAQNNQKYAVVGTFTPGISVASEEKYPFINDNYQIQLKSDDQLIDGKEFVLARVSNTGGIVTIVDQRVTNIFNFLSQQTDALNTVGVLSDIISCTEVKFKQTSGATDTSVAKIEWGLRSSTWTLNNDTRQLTVFSASGGLWQDLTQFAPQDFVGQYVVFEDGQSAQIISSAVIAGEVTFELEFQSQYVSTGDIVITVAGIVELQATHITKNFTHKYLSVGFAGYAHLELPPGTYSIQYRIIQTNSISQWSEIGEGQYLTESSFNANGFVIAGEEVYAQSTDGQITISTSPSALFSLLNAIVFPGVVWDYFGPLNAVPSGWVLCDGSLINSPESIFHNTNSPDLRKKVTVGHDTSDVEYNAIGASVGDNSKSISVQQLPAHSHTGTTNSDGEHSHTIDQNVVVSGVGSNALTIIDNTAGSAQIIQTEVDGAHSHAFTTQDTGQGDPFDVRQSSLVCYKIMKL